MTIHRYPTLLVAALAAAFIGAAGAQTQSDDTSRMPATKGMAQEAQTQPSTDPTDKMKGQDQSAMQGHAMKSDQKAKTAKNAADQPAHMAQAGDKSTKQGTKSKRSTEEAVSPDQKAYREALRDCVKQSNEGQRDSCIDSAIEKFHRNA